MASPRWGIQAHIIDSPTIDGNRAHALARDLCALSQTDVDLLRNLASDPSAVSSCKLTGPLGMAVNQLNIR